MRCLDWAYLRYLPVSHLNASAKACEPSCPLRFHRRASCGRAESGSDHSVARVEFLLLARRTCCWLDADPANGTFSAWQGKSEAGLQYRTARFGQHMIELLGASAFILVVCRGVTEPLDRQARRDPEDDSRGFRQCPLASRMVQAVVDRSATKRITSPTSRRISGNGGRGRWSGFTDGSCGLIDAQGNVLLDKLQARSR